MLTGGADTVLWDLGEDGIIPDAGITVAMGTHMDAGMWLQGVITADMGAPSMVADTVMAVGTAVVMAVVLAVGTAAVTVVGTAATDNKL